jgi:CRISPR-associated protein Csb2
MLVLEVEWLTGVCFAARSPADEAPDWPVQPDRVFSALVATWGAHGCPAEERSALEWLETLGAPRMEAAEAMARVSVTAFVPPNDVATLPDRRRRQPRRFPASMLRAELGSPHLRILWDEAPASSLYLPALQALARDTSYVGHSSALVRCRFLNDNGGAASLVACEVVAAPFHGRLHELESLHGRHIENGDANARPRPAMLALRRATAKAKGARSLFGREWIVLAAADAERPDIRAAAVIARAMRYALMSAYGDPIPDWLSGHSADGTPSENPHLAVVPMADVGFTYSDGRLMGLGIVLPRDREEAWRGAATPAAFEEWRALSRALERLRADKADVGDHRPIALRLGPAGLWRLRLAQGSELKSLDPARYCARSALWSSATPIALDRHTKRQGAARLEEAAEITAESCIRLGLPRPARVRVHKHAAIAGAPSAWPPGGAPAWTGWARPKTLAHRLLFHATIEFSEPVRGPVIIGAGRFFGLGLCLPRSAGEGT